MPPGDRASSCRCVVELKLVVFVRCWLPCGSQNSLSRHKNSQNVYQVLLVVQVLSIVMSGVLLSSAFWSGLSIVDGWVFLALLVLQMVEKLSAVTSEVAIERDWITRICGKENTAGLAHGNSMIRRFDLACDFLGTVGVGVIIDRLGVGLAVWYCVLMSILSWPVINSRLRLLDIDNDEEGGVGMAVSNGGSYDDRGDDGEDGGSSGDKPSSSTRRLATSESKQNEPIQNERMIRRNTVYAYFFDNPMLFSSLVGTCLVALWCHRSSPAASRCGASLRSLRCHGYVSISTHSP